MRKRVFAILLSLVMVCAFVCPAVSANSTLSVQNGTLSVTVNDEEATGVTFYEATPLTFSAAYGTTDGNTISDATAFDQSVAASMQEGCDGVTTDSSSGLPYQLFEVDVSTVTASSILLSYDGATIENERFALKVYNPQTAAWDTLGTAVSSGQISAEVPLATYASEGVVKAMATVDYVANGSSTILWSTDPQHYVKFDDLNSTYYALHEYMATEYQAGNIGYVVTTGDIVDDMPNLSGAAKQWKTASSAFSILDEAGVPYGIVTGNHDTGDYPAINYRYFWQYFGEERYADQPWYGGTEDDNACHYDLVTIGNVDFLFLYLGYGVEGDDDTIEWANSVLQAYPHRNAVICTHSYLSSRKVTWSSSSRASVIFESIISQNPNVLMVLCGHDDGACYTTSVTDDGRTVYEILCDYQFVQAESDEYYADAPDPTHSIGSTRDCNGEGYIRSITIEGNTVSMDTFSPITGGTTPYGVRDQLSIDVDFQEAQRQITTRTFTAAVCEKALGKVNADGSGEYSLQASSDATAFMAAIDTADGDTLYTPAAYSAPSGADTAAVTVYADKDNLQALIDSSNTLDKSLYVKDSWNEMTDARSAAKKAIKSGSDEEIRAAYTALAGAIGRLEEVDNTVMDRNKLIEVYSYNMDPAMWQNSNGKKSLTSSASFIDTTVTEDGGLTIQASSVSPNSYPQMTYTEAVTFTPQDEKVYLYLDIHATNGWSMYPSIMQDGKVVSTRWNYIIEGSANNTWDAGNGDFVGVYDVTQALLDSGFDLTKPLNITMAINVVPGPMTINEITFLTGAYPEGIVWNDILPWIVVGAVILVAVVGLILFAIFYQPKKPTPAAAAPAAVTETAEAIDSAPAEFSAATDAAEQTDAAPPTDDAAPPQEETP